MAKPKPQEVHALVTYYIKCYEAKKGKTPVLNRNKVRYWLESMLMDYTGAEARELIDYYVDKWAEPSIDWFAFNYDKVDEDKTEYEKNKLSNAAKRSETERRLEEWRNRWKKS